MTVFDKFRSLPSLFINEKMLVPITLKRGTGTFDPKTMKKKGSGSTTIEGHGVLSIVKTADDNGALVMTTVAKLTVEPKINDRLFIGGNEYTINSESAVQPDGHAFFWSVVVS